VNIYSPISVNLPARGLLSLKDDKFLILPGFSRIFSGTKCSSGFLFDAWNELAMLTALYFMLIFLLSQFSA